MRFSITLPEDMSSKLVEYSKVLGVSPTALIKIALGEYVKANEFLKGLDMLREFKEKGGETDETG